MKIETIMTKDIIFGHMNDSIREVSKKMKEFDIGFLPIVFNHKVIGVITDRDLVVRAFSNGASGEDEIEKYMTKTLISIDLYQPLESAIKLMGEAKVKRLLVTNKKKLVGVVSFADFIQTELACEDLVTSLKQLWTIYRNIDTYETEIDEFYL